MTEEQSDAFEFAQVFTAHYWVRFIARVAAVSLMLVVGFAGVGLLNDCEPAAGKLQRGDGSWMYARSIAVHTAIPLVCVAVLLETAIPLALHFGLKWSLGLWLLPLGWAAVGAFLVHQVFQLDEVPYEPKTATLCAGGALLFYLCASFQASMWQVACLPQETGDMPFAWHFVVVLLAATFFGAQRGWTDISPIAKRLFDYRRSTWPVDRTAAPPGEPVEGAWMN